MQHIKDHEAFIYRGFLKSNNRIINSKQKSNISKILCLNLSAVLG